MSKGIKKLSIHVVLLCVLLTQVAFMSGKETNNLDRLSFRSNFFIFNSCNWFFYKLHDKGTSGQDS